MSEAQAAMTFREHLTELRSRVFKATIALMVGFFVAWNWHIELYAILTLPLREAMAANNLFAIKALAITESIEVYMKLSLMGGIFVASPYIFWQIWAFVAPGLLTKEKRLILPVVVASVGCFTLGALFCYLVALPFMADFLIRMTLEAPGLLLEPTIAGSVSFVLFLLLGFGVVFELPLFMYVLSALELVTWRGFLGFYRYWVVIAFIIGAVLTPTPDPINQTIMSAPLVLLYGVGVLVAWLAENKAQPGLARRLLFPIALVLALVAIAATVVVLKKRDAPPIADVPADVQELLGLHTVAADELLQSADQTLGPVVAPLRLAKNFEWKPQDGQWLLMHEGKASAVLLQMENAPGQIDKLGAKFHATVVTTKEVRTLVFATDAGNWRATAVGNRILWLGREAVLDRLTAVRAGNLPALNREALMAERLTTLQNQGPAWALTAGQAGVAQWLPGGALAQHVKVGVAAWTEKELTLKLECRGPEAAVALRDRLETWLADVRQADTHGETVLARRLGRLAGLLAQAWQVQARTAGVNNPDAREWSNLAREANNLAQEVGLPTGQTRSDDPLARLLQPPTESHVTAEGSLVVWRLEMDKSRILQMLLASHQ